MFVSLSVGLAAMPLFPHVSSPQRGRTVWSLGMRIRIRPFGFQDVPVHNRLNSGVKITFNVE
jgi:hypothetical protein